jgi:uncharacterized protein (DUF2147 family)
MRAVAWWAGALLAAAPSLQAQPAGAADASGLLGEWWTPGFNARVRIEACDGGVCGRIVWAWDDQPKDIVDRRPLVGQTVIQAMRADGPQRWKGGRLYNPEDGRDYKGGLHLQAPTRLLVEGCVLFICKQQVWRRADAAQCPPVAPDPASVANAPPSMR